MMARKLYIYQFLLLISLNLISIPIHGESKNLIRNPGFEDLKNNVPEYWYKDGSPPNSLFSIENGAHTGRNCMAINNPTGAVSGIIQDVPVKLGQVYKISVWLKTEKIDTHNPAAASLTILNGIYETKNIFDTKGEWQIVEAYVRVRPRGTNVLNFCLRLGGFGANAKGKVYFDDASMELVENPPAGVKIDEFFIPHDDNADKKADTSNLMDYVWIIIGFVVIGGLIFIEIFFIGKKDADN